MRVLVRIKSFDSVCSQYSIIEPAQSLFKILQLFVLFFSCPFKFLLVCCSYQCCLLIMKHDNKILMICMKCSNKMNHLFIKITAELLQCLLVHVMIAVYDNICFFSNIKLHTVMTALYNNICFFL